MIMERIVIGSDHGGFELKSYIMSKWGQVHRPCPQDIGTYSTDSLDYPDIAQQAVEKIINKEADLGILICGTGIGMSIKANRFNEIRAALVYDEYTAKMAKAHNNANIICLGGRTIKKDTAIKLINVWLETDFENGRHSKRIQKLSQ
jgi:ribose 5-phosphate isomerase B